LTRPAAEAHLRHLFAMECKGWALALEIVGHARGVAL
jgi:hypothetical protein